jgi:hypothetical protein
METYVVLAYEKGMGKKYTHLVAVCDSQFIAQKYADNEAKASNGRFGCEVHKRLMNELFAQPNTLVYQTK